MRLNPGISRLENFRDPIIRESRNPRIAMVTVVHNIKIQYKILLIWNTDTNTVRENVRKFFADLLNICWYLYRNISSISYRNRERRSITILEVLLILYSILTVFVYISINQFICTVTIAYRKSHSGQFDTYTDGCQDTSDPRHFGTIRLVPKCPDSSALVPKWH